MRRKKMMTAFIGELGFKLPDNKLLIIIWRELLDALRDRRTIIAAFILPIVTIPIFMNLPLFFMSPTRNPARTGIVNLDPQAVFLVKALNETPTLTVSNVDPELNHTALVQENVYDLIVVIPENFTDKITGGESVNLTIIYDPSSMVSETGRTSVTVIVNEISKSITYQRLSKLNISKETIEPIKISSVTVRKVGFGEVMASMMLPIFVAVFSVAGAASFVFDSTAGEKERRTLEVLISSPVPSRTLIAGKYLSATLITLITGILTVASLILSMRIQVSLFQTGEASVTSLEFSPGLVLGLLASIVIGGLTGNALTMALGVFAKSFREAQQYFGALNTIIMVPAIIVAYLPPRMLDFTLYLPIASLVAILRKIIVKTATIPNIVVAYGVSIVYLTIFISIAVRLFRSERVLFRV